MDKKISNELKVLALEMINNAGSGHSGSVLSCGDAIYTLYTRHILTNGEKDINRDRFVLSNGHVCASLYSVLAGLGYIEFDELKNFRQYGGKLAGHPEIEVSPIDANTGPLGQGVANAVGMAIAETIMNERFGVDHYTYCMCGDGCLQEGVALEALSIAGLHKLNKFILFYDQNNVTLDANTTASSTDDIVMKFKSMNFNVLKCDGYDIEKIDKTILKAQNSKSKPTVIILKTRIGKDTSLENNHKSHGYVYNKTEIDNLKKLYKNNNNYLDLNKETKKYLNSIKLAINTKFQEKINSFDENLNKNKEKLKKYNNFIKNNFKFKSKLIKEKIATRNQNNVILNDISKTVENIVVLIADLSSSTKVKIEDGGIYSSENRLGRNISLGIREHAMGAIANGIALHGGLIPITSTFLCFSNYMLPSLRMASVMKLPVIFTFSHSSAYDNADGISHVPVEQLDQLRLIPNLTTFRPCDSVEIKASYDWFFENKGPICLCVSKYATNPVLSKDDVSTGAYFVTNDNADINIMASGTEVEIALSVREELLKHNIVANVISMLSIEVFEKQSEKFKAKFLNKPLFVIETSTCVKYFKYTNCKHVFNMSNFGLTGNPECLKKHFCFDTECIALKIRKLIK